eukprot:224365_1
MSHHHPLRHLKKPIQKYHFNHYHHQSKRQNICMHLRTITRRNTLCHHHNPMTFQPFLHHTSTFSASTDTPSSEAQRKDPDIMYAYESQLHHEEDPANAKVIFELIFGEISGQMGGDSNMVFPKDIMWLCGAPGSGKGEMSQWIMYQRGYHAEPIRISAILSGEEIEQLKSSGKLVSDRIVLTILLQKLLLPEYRTGVIVDGFPRTKLQAECIKLLFDKMLQLRRRYDGTQHFVKFRRPKFHITVLYVDKEISIQRQLSRGKAIAEHNELVDKTGIGQCMPSRNTDNDAEKARQRYEYFHEHIYQSIRSMKGKFPFHFISAEAPLDIVKSRILKELEYQSSAELGDDTFDMVRQMSLASEIKLDARHKLVTRLDLYATQEYKQLFQQVINVFKFEFEPLVRQQALMGTCIVSSENNIFEINDSIGLTMMLDLLAERGYRAILDVLRTEKPIKIDLQSGEIQYHTHKIYKFHIHFPPPKMRHAIHTYDTDVQ